MLSLNSFHNPFPSAGGQIHWSPKPSSPASTAFWPGTQSVDIELTAYVLLAYLSKPRVHAGDMTTAAAIVAWLTRQQNAYGGFASTQVTSSSPWILSCPRLAAQSLLVFLLRASLVTAGAFRGVSVCPSAGHGGGLASPSEVRSAGVQHGGPGGGEGVAADGPREGIPGQPPAAAASAAGSAGGDPGAAPAAGPRQQLCLCSGEEVG